MKERIIFESIKSLREEGLKFSIDTLALRLNISKKTIYKYFPNKETLAIALYEKYYQDAKVEVEKLIKENSVSSHRKLLLLYFDAKMITCCAIFNKYMLNDSIFSYTKEQNDYLLKMILSTIKKDYNQDKTSFEIIINGTFEKLCNEKINPIRIIESMVNILW